MRDAVSGEKIGEVEPKTHFRVMRVTILETFDVADGARFVKIVFKLRHSNLDCGKTVDGCDLSRGPHCEEATRRPCNDDEYQPRGRFQHALVHEVLLNGRVNHRLTKFLESFFHLRCSHICSQVRHDGSQVMPRRGTLSRLRPIVCRSASLDRNR